jgi:protein-L-isoaspartate(D-aspartate) O-methyltransferase
MNIDTARQQMIEQQVRAWEVLDSRVLDVLAAVPRENFVPEAMRAVAFADTDIPIGRDQTLLAPNLHGRILQALEITPRDHVLEIGTGTGCLAAYLGKLAYKVKSLEIYPDFAASARINLRAIAANNVEIIERDAFGSEPIGEYDAIALTGSLPIDDPRFERALKPGGRLFAVVGVGNSMEAQLVRRITQNQWVRESLFETSLQPLLHAPAAPAFVF